MWSTQFNPQYLMGSLPRLVLPNISAFLYTSGSHWWLLARPQILSELLLGQHRPSLLRGLPGSRGGSGSRQLGVVGSWACSRKRAQSQTTLLRSCKVHLRFAYLGHTLGKTKERFVSRSEHLPSTGLRTEPVNDSGELRSQDVGVSAEVRSWGSRTLTKKHPSAI